MMIQPHHWHRGRAVGGGVLFVTASSQQTIIWSDQDTMLHRTLPPFTPHCLHSARRVQSYREITCIYRVSQKKVGSQKISNCSNSLNFEAKINCNTIKQNVPKWRKTCIGLKFYLLNFYGPQSNIHTF